MNFRIETDEGQVVLKFAAHKTDPAKAVIKVPVNYDPGIAYVAQWCQALGVTELGASWPGNIYWMQEVNREQLLAAIGKLLGGEPLPEANFLQSMGPDEADYQEGGLGS
jgi:hypothetical protein